MLHRNRGRQEPATNALSRDNGLSHYQGKRERRKKSHIIWTVVIVILVVIAVGAIAFAAFYFDIDHRLTSRISPDLAAELSNTSEPSGPFYMLLLGVDKDEARAEDWGDDNSNFRTDTIILARVDPKNLKVTLVSITRDTLVDLGEYGQDKINAAYSYGGPALTVKTVENYAGVDINHYAEVDFETLTKIVDTIGGIDVNVPVDVEDPYSNADIKAGEQTLNGEQALALCRSRHAYDAYGAGDFYRAANQRMVIAAIVKKVLASNPLTITSTIENLADGVTTDMDVGQIISLAMQMKDLDVDNDVYSGMNPTIGEDINGVSYQITDQQAWRAMMHRVDSGETPYERADDDPTYGVAGSTGNAGYDENGISTTNGDASSSDEDYSGAVEVLNATGIPGAATDAANQLNDAGFNATADTAQDISKGITIVYHGADNRAKANAAGKVLSSLGKSITCFDDSNGVYAYTSDILVILGT